MARTRLTSDLVHDVLERYERTLQRYDPITDRLPRGLHAAAIQKILGRLGVERATSTITKACKEHEWAVEVFSMTRPRGVGVTGWGSWVHEKSVQTLQAIYEAEHERRTAELERLAARLEYFGQESSVEVRYHVSGSHERGCVTVYGLEIETVQLLLDLAEKRRKHQR